LKQKGTGRARQGSTRSPLWPGGGTAFGPTPHRYRTELPRKVRQLARQSALNARANEGQLHVIEALEFDAPKTSRMAELLDQLALAGRKVLILTQEHRQPVYLSARNIPRVQVMRYADASAFDVTWSDAVLVEEAAVGGRAVAGTATPREKRARKAAAAPARKPAAKPKPKAKAAAKPKAAARKKKEQADG